MNSRFALVLAVLLAVGVAFFVWWRVDSTSASTERVAPEFFAETRDSAPTSELARATSPADARARVTASAPRTGEALDAISDNSRVTRIVGNVRSRTESKPVAGGYVTAERLTRDGVTVKPEMCGLDGRGHYTLLGLKAGVWKVKCIAEGYESQEQNAVVEDGREAVLDFDLVSMVHVQKFSVFLHAPGGRSFENAARDAGAAETVNLLRILCVENCPQRGVTLPSGAGLLVCRASNVRSDRKGPAPDPPAATDEWFRVTIEHQGGACCVLLLGDRVLDVAPFSEGSARIDLVVSLDDLRSATGSVTLVAIDDASGAPIVGAAVRVRSDSGHWGEGTTDANGKATIARVMAGDAVLEVTTKEHAKSEQKLLVRGALDTDVGVVRMHANASTAPRNGLQRGPAPK